MLNPTRAILGIPTNRFPEMSNFYQQVLGKPVGGKPDRWIAFSIGNTRLVIWQNKGPKSKGSNGFQLCLEVGDLVRTHEAIGDLFPLSDIKYEDHGKESFLQDPDGNPLILYEPEAKIGTPHNPNPKP